MLILLRLQSAHVFAKPVVAFEEVGSGQHDRRALLAPGNVQQPVQGTEGMAQALLLCAEAGVIRLDGWCLEKLVGNGELQVKGEAREERAKEAEVSRAFLAAASQLTS